MQSWLRRLAISIAAIMFLIIVMGALVTKTESGLGCGYEWPLCNGKFVPAYTISSMIEYSHRAVVGVFTLLLLLTTILVFFKSGRSDAKWLVAGALFFTLLQAVMGALAVVFPQSPPVLAIHFGLSLLAYAFCFLLAVVLRIPTQLPIVKQHMDHSLDENKQADTIVNKMKKDMKILIWSILIFTYVVIYLGAFVRHTTSSGGCSGWPLCNGEVIPELTGATGIVFIHRVAALLLSIAIIGLFVFIYRRYPRDHTYVRTVNFIAIFLFLQVMSGAVVTWSVGTDTYYLFAAMLHAVIITLLFGYISYLAMLTFWNKALKTT
jgi:cytochrome c oxidase assembly protein subunit 15